MYCLTVTIAATGVRQPIIPQTQNGLPGTNTSFQALYCQNNGSNPMAIGDYLVTMTNGLLLFPVGSLDAMNSLEYASDLKEFWVMGTAGDRLNLMVFP